MGVEDNGDGAPADRLLTKIRAFVADQLDEEEAALFAALVAPGVASAYQDQDPAEPGSGYEWCSRTLPDSLADALRDRAIRVEGLA